LSRAAAIVALVFVSLFSIDAGPAGASTTRIEELLKRLPFLGASVRVIPPFDDTSFGAECGYGGATRGTKIFLSMWDWKVAGYVDDAQRSIRNAVSISPTGELDCFDVIELSNTKFDEDALVGASITARRRSPSLKIVSTSQFHFTYDWKKLATDVNLEIGSREDKRVGKQLLELEFAIGVGGLDMIKLQEHKSAQHLALLNFFTASLRSARVKFRDGGALDLILELVAREEGVTKRKLQREVYSSLEQVRQFLQTLGSQGLSNAVEVLQEIIADGGGGEFTVQPSRPITALEFLGALEGNSLDEVLEALNLSSRRLR